MREDLTPPGVAARFKSKRAVAIARRLRKTMTPAEQMLWFELRRVRVPGTHFRRQAVIGPFVVDFICHTAMLAIEIDGGAHDAPDVAARDAERQQWIEGRGYRMLRFANAEVLCDPRRVARAICALASTCLPQRFTGKVSRGARRMGCRR
ncbi:MAG: endonuclease domain-containing protein [Hyphomonadaceae bacterium]|nr:endonuclease domain-containing protein [Hyphomonadaceae bacterium]